MPEYDYIARGAEGLPIKGTRQAQSAEALAQLLLSDGLTPIEIFAKHGLPHKITKPPVSTKKTFFKKSVSEDELHMFCRQMYSLLRAGIPLATAVARLSETTRDKRLSETLQQILQDLNKGRSLQSAMAVFPDIFSVFFINLINVGENTGKLDDIFLHLSEYLELELDTKKKIKTALRYPIMVIIAVLVALIIINAFVIPAFANMFKNFHGTLPLPTRILMASSEFLLHYWFYILILTIVSFVMFKRYINTAKGEVKWAHFVLKMPIIGWLIQRIIIARFTRLYALVLRAGITAVEGVKLVGASTGNAYFAEKISVVSDLIERGNTLGTALAQTALFPSLVIQMVTLGEESGSIDDLLGEASAYYQREVDYDLARLSDAIEPILIVIMSFMVLVLALGVFLPMWDMAAQMQRR